MRTLHAKYIKIVAAGGDLSTAPEKKLAKNAVVIKAEPSLVEHITADNPNPQERYEIGTGFELKGVLGDSDLDDLVFILGGTHTTNVYTKTQGVRTLPKYDIEVGVYRPSDAKIIKYTLTDMEFTAAVEESFEQGNVKYLPFTAQSVATSDLTIDNSAT